MFVTLCPCLNFDFYLFLHAWPSMVSPCNKPEVDTESCVDLSILSHPLHKRNIVGFITTRHLLNGNRMIKSSHPLFKGGTTEVGFDWLCDTEAVSGDISWCLPKTRDVTNIPLFSVILIITLAVVLTKKDDDNVFTE